MKAMTAGVTKAGKGINNLTLNILGQTYVPKSLSETSFSWHALLPPGTFVPPHIHINQDEFIYVLEGRFDLILDGKEATASAGEFIRLPMRVMHGLFNKSDQPIKCLFWVSPTGKLFDLFKKIDGVPDPAEVTRLAALHDVNFLPPPPGSQRA
jgi:mannose-6-phosphate isomerase-like protein (cupin superfamily)